MIRLLLVSLIGLLTLGFTACQTAPPPLPLATSTPLSPTPTAALVPVTTGQAVQPVPDDPPDTLIAQPLQGGVATLGLIGHPDLLNPITGNNPALREMTPLLFETLLQVDPQTARLQPGLAREWEYRQNGRQLVLHLPVGLQWSNGQPMTAAGLADSLTATRHPALQAFSTIRALDDETLVLTMTRVDCAAVTAVTQLPLLPAQEITATLPAGSGPFVIDTWTEDKQTLRLVPNPYYHGPPPQLVGLTLRFLSVDEVPIALSEGQFDLVGPVLASELPDPVAPFTPLTYPAPQMIYLAINYAPQNGSPLKPAVRQALYLALDREAILAETLAGQGLLLAASLLPDHWAADPALSPPGYDPETARDLLEQAGLRDRDGDGWLEQDGKRLELSIRVNGQNQLEQNLGWLISSYYRDLGLFARSEGVGFDSVVDDLFTHDFDLAIFSWPLLPDPDQRYYWQSDENTEGLGLNVTSYNSPAVDELLAEAVNVPGCDPEIRAEIYGEVQTVLAEERPVDFLLAPNRQLLVGERLRGLQPGPFAPLTWNSSDWSLEE